MNGSVLSIDRERFLALVVVLAAPGCGAPSSDAMVVAPVIVAPVEPLAPDAGSAPALVIAAPEGPRGTSEPAEAPSCETNNDVGKVDCSAVRALKLRGPSCEGVAETCESLADGHLYRARAGEAAAKCFARVGARICNIAERKKCFEEGVKASCPEAKYEQACEATIARCNKQHARLQYTKEDCMRALSALAATERDWALRAMGPSSEGKCQLMFTVY